MNNEIISFDPSFFELSKGLFDDKNLPKPFVSEIFLLDCHIAGTTHVDLSQIEARLTVEDLLVFKREPDNPVDPLAILILDTDGHKLGYVPRVKNEVLARLMDAGKMIFGKLKNKENIDNWLKLSVMVYMCIRRSKAHS